MKTAGLIALLQSLPADNEIVLEDLNGLFWMLEPSLVRVNGKLIVIGAKDINVVRKGR